MNKIKPCRQVFSETLLELAKDDSSIIVVTSDARGSVTLNDFAKELPDQFIEMGIAEQNEVGVAAGLATCGKKPFVCAPACFLSARSLEQIKVDLAYSQTNVKIFGVSGGVSYGALGASHHSLQDIAVMRAIPGIAVIIPSDRHLTEAMVKELIHYTGPVYIRVGRGAVEDVYTPSEVPFILGKSNVLINGNDLTIIAAGEMVKVGVDACSLLQEEGIHARIIDMHTIKPLDEEAIIKAAQETGAIITMEEHSVNGGLGDAVSKVVVENHPVPMKIIGMADENMVTGSSEEIYEHYNFTPLGIQEEVKKLLCKKRRWSRS